MSNDLDKVLAYFRFVHAGDEIAGSHQIVCRLSDQPLVQDPSLWIDELPVLYPLSDIKIWFRFDERSNLVFEHDILQSAFYLLSAQQEAETAQADEFGRFPYLGSIQQRLGIVSKPIVNYYFSIVLEAIKEFCLRRGITFRVTKPYGTFAFFLSHDIDRLYFHHPKEVVGRLLQLAGLRKREYAVRDLVRLLGRDVVSVWNYKKNDEWNKIDYLVRHAQLNHIHSAFYFLPKTNYRLDSRYRLDDDGIQHTIQKIHQQGFEVGLHWPLSKQANTHRYFGQITNLLGVEQLGVRRHYLAVAYPESFVQDALLNVLYDCSFGFSEKEGFRNSFCFPFRPYNHADESMVPAWVIPLTAMDVTYLLKQKTSFDGMLQSMNLLTDEIAKFGGVFSLLWHNCRFDERQLPGITAFYEEMINALSKKMAQGIPGREIIGYFEGLSDHSSFIIDCNNGLISNE